MACLGRHTHSLHYCTRVVEDMRTYVDISPQCFRSSVALPALTHSLPQPTSPSSKEARDDLASDEGSQKNRNPCPYLSIHPCPFLLASLKTSNLGNAKEKGKFFFSHTITPHPHLQASCATPLSGFGGNKNKEADVQI
ncbi:hypothetical protein M426DRAFT_79057 [Hypoxylon sp. CI-4A]|nr:hypothetical protein M426DRAFT_79057 [Hypoxylon sp. CI-4A]